MNREAREALKQIEGLSPGDLVEVWFFDASIGSSLTTSGIPIRSRSLGIYVGSVGEPKHLILCQNDFQYGDELRDEDYTAIPQPWATEVIVIKKRHVSPEEAEKMLKSILAGSGTRRRRGVFQMRVVNHEKLG